MKRILAAWLAAALGACAPAPLRFESLPGKPPLDAAWLRHPDSCRIEDGWMDFSRRGETRRLRLHFEWSDAGLSAAGLGPFDRLLFQAHWDEKGAKVREAAFSGMPFPPRRLAGEFLLLRLDPSRLQKALGPQWHFGGEASRRFWTRAGNPDTLFLVYGAGGSVEMRGGRGRNSWQAAVHVSETLNLPPSECSEGQPAPLFR